MYVERAFIQYIFEIFKSYIRNIYIFWIEFAMIDWVVKKAPSWQKYHRQAEIRSTSIANPPSSQYVGFTSPRYVIDFSPLVCAGRFMKWSFSAVDVLSASLINSFSAAFGKLSHNRRRKLTKGNPLLPKMLPWHL
jgi:hypothetical protein